MGTIRVVLAEDHALMRDAVKLVLEEEEDVVLVGFSTHRGSVIDGLGCL